VELDIECDSYLIKRVKSANKTAGRISITKRELKKLGNDVYIIPISVNTEIIVRDRFLLKSNFVFKKNIKEYSNANYIFINSYFIGADMLIVPASSVITTELTTNEYIIKKSTNRGVINITNECFYSQVVTSLPYIPLEDNRLKVVYMQTKAICDSEKFSSVNVPVDYKNTEFISLIDDLEEY